MIRQFFVYILIYNFANKNGKKKFQEIGHKIVLQYLYTFDKLIRGILQ